MALKKIGAALAAGVFAVSLLFGAGAALDGGASAQQTENFDENDIVLTFSNMSDSHVGYLNGAGQLSNALKVVKDLRPDGVDALLFCGDQTQNGTAAEAEEFVSVVEQHFDMTKTPVIVTHGNHDTYWAGCMTTTEFAAAYGSAMYTFDEADTDYRTGNRHVVVNGWHFLSVQIASYTGRNNTNPLSADTENWLRAMLDKLTEEAPDRYVFVSCHCPAPDTVYGSLADQDTGAWGSSKELDAVLKDYPQVILFSGHTHYALNDERAINQTTYTQVQSGSTSDADVDKGYLETGTGGYSTRRSESQGMLVEVDGGGRVRIMRVDFARGEQIKDYWYLDACSADGAHLDRYTAEAREASNAAPVFPEGAQISVKETAAGTVEITYPAASDDDMVFSYTIQLLKGDGTVAGTVRSLSPWYGDPSLSSLPDTRKLTMNYTVEYPYSVIVTAFDSFGKSASLTVEMRDTTEEDMQKAEALDERIRALADGALAEDDGGEIRSIRTELSSWSYKAIGYLEQYQTFLQLERRYYDAFFLSADAAQYAPSALNVWSNAPSAERGHAEDSEYTGVSLVWEGANKNNSLGFSFTFALDGLHICFSGLNITSENKIFALLLSDRTMDRWTTGECFLLTIDFGTGELNVNQSVSPGKSACLVSERLGAAPFELRFTQEENGDCTLLVSTLSGSETFTIAAEQLEGLEHLSGTEACYLSFSPWERNTSGSFDVVAVHGGVEECFAGDRPGTDGDQNENGTGGKGGCGGAVGAGTLPAAVLLLTAAAAAVRKTGRR